uniref:DUF1995 domain-containing protein n=1 Tax=Calcidiscus leptoporus TaxID=127549 RepID=A0A7S0P073_9EUKA
MSRSAAPSSYRVFDPPTATIEPVEAPRWFVAVPRSLQEASEQATRSVTGALRAGERRLLVEASLAEFEPTGTRFRFLELLAFTQQIGLAMLERTDLFPPARPHAKLLFSAMSDATLAGGCIQYNNLPVATLGSQSAMSARDGAFIVVAPRVSGGPPQKQAEMQRRLELAVCDVLSSAGSRPVVVVNPRFGASAAVDACQTAYLVRPLSVSFLQDNLAHEMSKGSACLLRCYPHMWSVMVDWASSGDWSYSGRFSSCPAPAQLEEIVRTGLMRERFKGQPVTEVAVEPEQ